MSPEAVETQEGEDAMELASWRSEWQSLGGREDLARELAERARKDGQRIRRAAALEISATAVATAFCVWFLAKSKGAPIVVALSVVILVFNGVWLTRLFTLREGTMRGVSPGEGLDAFVELTRRRIADDLRWNRFSRGATQVLATFIALWCAWAFVQGYSFYAAEPWRGVVGFGGAAAILGGLFVWQRRKAAKLETERERFEALVAERTLA